MKDENRSTALDHAGRAAVYTTIHGRRDVRTGFRKDPIDPAILRRLLDAAHAAPSVGFMQPWRFIRLGDPSVRTRLHALVEEERVRTADALGERRSEFLRLKVEGIRECAELWAVALMPGREAHVFGRRTLPEMDVASVGCAVQNLWLAARAEGIGVGWVSLFEPEPVSELLAMPAGSRPLGLLCLGFVDEFDPIPLLEREGWAERLPLRGVFYEDVWGVESQLLREQSAPCEGDDGGA